MKQLITKKIPLVWTVAIIVALVIGTFFLRHYISIILVSIVAAFIFSPIYRFFLRRYKRPGISASLTFLASLLILIVPIALIVLAAIFQVKHALTGASQSSSVDIGELGAQALQSLNNLLAHLPGAPHISTAQLNETINKALTSLASGLLSFLTTSFGSLSRLITDSIIYIYLFVNILMHQERLIQIVRKLNPLGNKIGDKYERQAGAMTKAMVVGQFIIAALQGSESTLVLYIAGIRSFDLLILLLLSFMSLIPLGAGIITIPLGLIMMATGHVWQGALIVANHLLIVTNIDNVVRPKLIPKTARLNSALTILSVFAGMSIFGFLGIVIGPVLMILLVTTIESYVAMKPEPKAKHK